MRPTILSLLIALCCMGAARAREPRAPFRTADRLVRDYAWSYKELQERQVVMQKRDYSCGAAALATVIRYYWGDPVTEEQFLVLLTKLLTPAEMKDRIENGLGLTDLRNLANKAGYQASMGKVTYEELTKAKIPVVVGLIVNGHEHFAVFRGAAAGWVYLADPLRGNQRTSIGQFQKQWQKNAILVVVKRGVKPKDVNPMSPHCDEINRGWLNNQLVRQNALTPKPVNPLVIPP